MTRYIEVPVLVNNSDLGSIGISDDLWAEGFIDLDCVAHLWRYNKQDNAVVLCTDLGETLFIVKSDYQRLKKILKDYKTSLNNYGVN